MKTFWIRTLSATVYALIFVGCIYAELLTGNAFLGAMIFSLFLTFVSVGCSYEFYRMTHKHRIRPMKWFGCIMCGLITLWAGFVFSNYGGGGNPVFPCDYSTLMLIMLVLVPLCLMIQLFRKSRRPVSDAIFTIFPFFYVAIPLGLMVYLNHVYQVMMMLLILVWINDSFAYMGGSLIGRHKMCPRISPGKTWEGTACGVVFTFVAAILIGPLFHIGLSMTDWLVIAFICSVFGTLGDLVESMMKRSFGLKDSGNIMPGHGGFLDRFDSLLVITPLVFVYLVVFVGLH